MATDTPQKTQSIKRTAFRFKPPDDIMLLKEVINHTPFSAGHGKTLDAWNKVANVLNSLLPRSNQFRLDKIACRRRFDNLLKAFCEKEMESLRASGTEKEYEERERLLTDLNEIEKEVITQKKEKTEKEKNEIQKRENIDAEIIAASLNRLKKTKLQSSSKISSIINDSSDDNEFSLMTYSEKKQKKTHLSILDDFVETQNNRYISEHEFKQKEFSLEEKKVVLENEKMILEKEKIIIEKAKIAIEEIRIEMKRAERSANTKLLLALVEKMSK